MLITPVARPSQLLPALSARAAGKVGDQAWFVAELKSICGTLLTEHLSSLN